MVDEFDCQTIFVYFFSVWWVWVWQERGRRSSTTVLTREGVVVSCSMNARGLVLMAVFVLTLTVLRVVVVVVGGGAARKPPRLVWDGSRTSASM